MNRRLATIRASVAVAAAVIFAVSMGSNTTLASTSASDAVACGLLSSTQARSTLGLSQSTILRNYDGSGPISAAIRTDCILGVWSGTAPTSTTAIFALARSGHAAQIAIETWAPHDGSPNVKLWLDDEYDELTGEFIKASVIFPGLFSTAGWPAHKIVVPGLGYDRAGFQVAAQGLGKGLVAALGCWWSDKQSSAICMLVEEASGKPVVKHLGQLAKIAVPKFL